MDKLYLLYLKAFNRILNEKFTEENLEYLSKKLIVYGVNIVNILNTIPESKNDIETHFTMTNSIIILMSILTPTEFVNLFPIEKIYNGQKYGVKDYFYTISYLKTLDPNEPIGKEILYLLWNYTNSDIERFSINIMNYLIDLRPVAIQPSFINITTLISQIGIKHYDRTNPEYLYKLNK